LSRKAARGVEFADRTDPRGVVPIDDAVGDEM
jgi:hypothetical protein